MFLSNGKSEYDGVVFVVLSHMHHDAEIDFKILAQQGTVQEIFCLKILHTLQTSGAKLNHGSNPEVRRVVRPL